LYRPLRSGEIPAFRLCPFERNPHSLKNKVRKSGKFSASKNVVHNHHTNHTFHHNFTIKKPHPNTLFFQNPS